MQQERNPTTVSQLLTQIQDLQNKANSLSDTREFHDPASGSRSGATHDPDQTSTILSSRTLPCCDSGLPRNTQNCTGIMGNVFERPPAQEGQSSAIFNNSKNLPSSSQDMRPDCSETARRFSKREPLNMQIQLPSFLSRSGIGDHTGGTYSRFGMMDDPRVPKMEHFLTLWNFKAGSLTSELKFVCEQPNLYKDSQTWSV